MATFKVGQRVRIKPFNGWPAAEGRIESTVDASGDDTCASVLVDGYPTPAWSMYRTWSIPKHQLEPIQPERNQTIAWSECVWRPEHLRETT